MTTISTSTNPKFPTTISTTNTIPTPIFSTIIPTSPIIRSRGAVVTKRCKTKAKKPWDKKTDIIRTLWSRNEELILAECYIQVYKDPNVGSDQNNDIFCYKVLNQYNPQAKHNGYKERTKNTLMEYGLWWTEKLGNVTRFLNKPRGLAEKMMKIWWHKLKFSIKTSREEILLTKEVGLFWKTNTNGKNPDFTQTRRNVSRNYATTISFRLWHKVGTNELRDYDDS